MTERERTDSGSRKAQARGRGEAPQSPERTAADIQRWGTLLTAAWQLVAAILLPALLGWWLDGKFHTKPWLMLAGALLGIAAGLIGFIRTALAAGRPPGQPPRKPPSPR